MSSDCRCNQCGCTFEPVWLGSHSLCSDCESEANEAASLAAAEARESLTDMGYTGDIEGASHTVRCRVFHSQESSGRFEGGDIHRCARCECEIKSDFSMCESCLSTARAESEERDRQREYEQSKIDSELDSIVRRYT